MTHFHGISTGKSVILNIDQIHPWAGSSKKLYDGIVIETKQRLGFALAGLGRFICLCVSEKDNDKDNDKEKGVRRITETLIV